MPNYIWVLIAGKSSAKLETSGRSVPKVKSVIGSSAGKSVPNYIWFLVAGKSGAKLQNCREICANLGLNRLVAGKFGAKHQNCREICAKVHLGLSSRKIWCKASKPQAIPCRIRFGSQ